MKKIFFIVVLLALSNIIYSQDFASKPFTIIQKWVKGNKSILSIKKEKPTGYVVASEEDTKLVLEKKQGYVIYDITFYYKENILACIMFTQHSSRALRLMIELEDLGFEDVQSFQLNGVEAIVYENNLKEVAVIIIDEKKRIILCTFKK